MNSVLCHDDLLQGYSDTELIQHVGASLRLMPNSRLSLLFGKLVVKQYELSEVEDAIQAIAFARQLCIPAPSIKRVVTDQRNAYCIMDYIEGTALEDAWLNISWLLTFKLALQLRHVVKRLRSVTSSTAGSLASGECRSFWLDDRYGIPPKSNAEDFACFFRFWANFTGMRSAIQAANQGRVVLDSQKRASCLESETFVFTHHDLAPRNIILAPSGDLWLIDWDYAGSYPIYFEYASMQNFHVPKEWNSLARLRQQLLTWISVGRYEQSARILRHIRSKFTRFPIGRRFELLNIGGPRRYPVS